MGNNCCVSQNYQKTEENLNPNQDSQGSCKPKSPKKNTDSPTPSNSDLPKARFYAQATFGGVQPSIDPKETGLATFGQKQSSQNGAGISVEELKRQKTPNINLNKK